MTISTRRSSLIGLLFFLVAMPCMATTNISTPEQAISFINTIQLPDSNANWPHVRSHLFLDNLRSNILNPFTMYQGSNTNFCGYAALSYIPLHDDPLGYARFMVALYRDGEATWNGINFTPSLAVKNAAGTLRFKGVLDIRPADQIWFLILADHFRSYLNFFFPHFHEGSEDTFWAACNFGKFNRIIRQLFKYQVEAKGSDLIRPGIHGLYEYLHDKVRTGTTFLYVNNNYLYKKEHSKARASLPTHYIMLTGIHRDGDLITITYWDYGERSLREVSLPFLKKIN